MFRLLGEEVADVVFVSPPWGRSYQRHAKKVSPQDATTIQFHCRVQKSDVRSILPVSGNCTCPKTEDKQVSPDYMIVWAKMSDVDLAVSLSQCDNHVGLARSFKSDHIAKGIRLTKHDFAAAFAKLRPDDDPPNVAPHNFFFRVEPTPVGTTSGQAQASIDAHGWRAKPVRSFSAGAWLCVAEKQFEEVFLQWNDRPVLVKWLQQRKEKQPIVLAGNIQKSLRVTQIDTPNGAQDHVNQIDPWGTWIRNHRGFGLNQSSNGPKPSNALPFVQPAKVGSSY